MAIAVKLDSACVKQKVLRAGRPVGIELEQHRYASAAKENAEQKIQRENEADASFNRLWSAVQCDYNAALAARDVDETHRIWCRTCELWLYFNQSEEKASPDEKLATRKSTRRRGQPLPYLEQELVSNRVGSADQRHTGRGWRYSSALLATRRVLA